VTTEISGAAVGRPTIFISYSHQDEAWKDRLTKHLRTLEAEGVLEVWDDRKISAGAIWASEIEEAISRSAVAILLVSADFLTSSFILEKEVPHLIRQRTSGHLRIIPVIVHPCPWQEIKWLSSMQCRPRMAEPSPDGKRTRLRKPSLRLPGRSGPWSVQTTRSTEVRPRPLL